MFLNICQHIPRHYPTWRELVRVSPSRHSECYGENSIASITCSIYSLNMSQTRTGPGADM